MYQAIKPLPFKTLLAAAEDGSNLAEKLSSGDLAAIADECLRGHAEDASSNDEDAELLAEIKEELKFLPAPDDSRSTRGNRAKLPVLARACLGFSSRAYPLIFEQENLVEFRPRGAAKGYQKEGGEQGDAKADAAARMSKYVTWQLREQGDSTWESETEDLLVQLAAYGTVFRLPYWDEAENRLAYKLISRESLVINRRAKDMTVDPFSVVDTVYGYELMEAAASGYYTEPKGGWTQEYDKTYALIERWQRIDLDGDGYPEPYRITIAGTAVATDDCGDIVGGGDVVRVVPVWDGEPDMRASGKPGRIKCRCDVVKYRFHPSLDKSFWGGGFGHLIVSAARSANKSLNSLLDAGELANTAMGFINRGAGLNPGTLKVERGKFAQVSPPDGDLSRAVFQLKFQPPSQALYELMQFCLQYAEEASGMGEVLQGEAIRANVPMGTVIGQTEEALKPFRATLRGVYNSLSKEFRAIFRLDAEHPDNRSYRTLLDEQADMTQDFDTESWDSYPYLNVNDVTALQRINKGGAVLDLAKNGMAEPKASARYYMRTLGIDKEDQEELLDFQPTDQDKQLQMAVAQQEADKTRLEQQKAEIELIKLKQAERKTDIDEAEANARIGKTLAETGKIAKEAEAVEQKDYVEDSDAS